MLILAIEILVSCGKQMGFYAPQVPVHLGPAVCPVLLPRHWKGPVLDRWFDNVGKRITAEKLTVFLTQLITIKNQAEKMLPVVPVLQRDCGAPTGVGRTVLH